MMESFFAFFGVGLMAPNIYNSPCSDEDLSVAADPGAGHENEFDDAG
jgi:hypothetical protein